MGIDLISGSSCHLSAVTVLLEKVPKGTERKAGSVDIGTSRAVFPRVQVSVHGWGVTTNPKDWVGERGNGRGKDPLVVDYLERRTTKETVDSQTEKIRNH